tara:strand:- start:5301 stop:6353 length:1053 start_codon:yes stop_codon:yes gene_type:complete
MHVLMPAELEKGIIKKVVYTIKYNNDPILRALCPHIKNFSPTLIHEKVNRYSFLEEVAIATQDVLQASLVLDDRDQEVPSAMKESIRFILNTILGYKAPTKAVEYGMGGAAFLYRRLPPAYQEVVQPYDINMGAVIHANKLLEEGGYPKRGSIGNIYEMAEMHNNLELVLGINAWDSALDLDLAVKPVFEALGEGGIFLHIQDVAPGGHLVLNHEARNRVNKGISADIKVYSDNASRHVTTTTMIGGLESYTDSGYKTVSSVDFFNLELMNSAKRAGFKVRDEYFIVGTFAPLDDTQCDSEPTGNVVIKHSISTASHFDFGEDAINFPDNHQLQVCYLKAVIAQKPKNPK